MSTYVSPTDVSAATLIRSATINDLDAAVGNAFALLPTETHLNRGTTQYAVDTGVVNAYLVSLPYAPSGYVDGLRVTFRSLNTNTGASTINVNGLGVKSIRLTSGADTAAGDITAGSPLEIFYSTATGFFHIGPSSATSSINAAIVTERTAVETLTNKTLTTPVVNGLTGNTSIWNIGAGQFYKDSAGNVGLGTSVPISRASIQTVATGAGVIPIALTLNNPTGYGAGTGLNGVGIRFAHTPSDAGSTGIIADIVGVSESETSSTTGALVLKTRAGASEVTTECMRLDSIGNQINTPSNTPPTLSINGQMNLTPTSNTNMRISYRGSDGVTRVGNITLA